MDLPTLQLMLTRTRRNLAECQAFLNGEAPDREKYGALQGEVDSLVAIEIMEEEIAALRAQERAA